MDSFDLLASDNPDLLLIASIVASMKSLRLSAKNHIMQRDANKNRADVSQREGDDEGYHYYLNEYLDEENKYQLILQQLHDFGISDKGCEEIHKPAKR